MNCSVLASSAVFCSCLITWSAVNLCSLQRHIVQQRVRSVCRIVCTLCQQTLPKLWFANVNVTSHCGVTNSLYPVTMTVIRHCSILDFGRGAYNQKFAPGITRPLHATAASEAHFVTVSVTWGIFFVV